MREVAKNVESSVPGLSVNIRRRPAARLSMLKEISAEKHRCRQISQCHHTAERGLERRESENHGLAFKQQTQELFVVSKANMCVKFNIPATDNTPVQRMTLEVQRLIYPRGIAFSQLHDSLYIIDWVKMSSGALIVYRIANSGSTTINIDAQPFGVSTLEKKNKVDIYVTCSSCQIIVFCDDGRAVNKSRRLHLPSSFQLPRHAVPLCQPAAADDGGRDVETFVVCWMSKRISHVSKVRTSLRDKDRLEEVAVYGTTGWCEFVTRQSYANSLILFPLAAQKLKHIYKK
jgi:hypothetical protein